MTKEALLALIKEGKIDDIKALVNENIGYVTLLLDEQKSLIHYAAEYGYLTLIQLLLKKNPFLLHQPDAHGYAPIHWAAGRGHHKVFQYLIKHGADINVRVGKMQYHPIHIAAINGQLDIITLLLNINPELLNITDKSGQTLLTWALDGGHYGAASCLILKIMTPQNQSAILSLIQTADLALRLMTLEPTMVAIFLRDQRIYRLIREDDNCSITEKSMKWYKPHGRRPSWFVNIDKETGASTVFEPVRKLGEGSFGTVRLFRSADNQNIAVKSLKKDTPYTSESELYRTKKELKREAKFNKRAYPNENLFETFEFHSQNNERKAYNNRFVFRYIEGEIAASFFKNIINEHILAKIILQMAQELQRIHGPDVAIIHGDIKKDNIIVYQKNNEFAIRVIDFGCSKCIGENVDARMMGVAKKTHYAPELHGKVFLKPHVNQDIYSLGYMLNSIFGEHPTHQKLMQSFPSISTFITTSQNENPMKRPSLESFCQELDFELNIQPKIDALLNSRNSVFETTNHQPIKILQPISAQQKTSFVQLRKELISLAQSPELTEAQGTLLNCVLDKPKLMTWIFEKDKNKIFQNFLCYALVYGNSEIVLRIT